jgi:hypothetical protein
VHLRVVDAECIDLDDHKTGLGFRLGNFLVDSNPPNFSRTMARIAASISQRRALVAKSAAKEIPHCCGNFRGVGLQREVSSVHEAHDRVRHIASERLGTLR